VEVVCECDEVGGEELMVRSGVVEAEVGAVVWLLFMEEVLVLVLVRGVEVTEVDVVDDVTSCWVWPRRWCSSICTCATVCAPHHASRRVIQCNRPSFHPISACSASCLFLFRACRRSEICAPTLSGPSNRYAGFVSLLVILTRSRISSPSESAADSEEHSRSRHSSGSKPRAVGP